MSPADRRLFFLAVLFLAVFPQAVSSFDAVSHYVDIMVFVGIYSLVTLGLCMLMGYAGQISLAQAAFFGVGAYSSGILTVHLGWNPWAAMVAGAVVAALLAWAVGIPALRLKGHYLAMATLGFGVIVHIVFKEEGEWTGGPSGLVGIPPLTAGGWELYREIHWYYLVWGTVLVALLFCFHVIRSRVGRALMAIHEEEKAAEAMGVPTARYKVQVFVLSGVFAAVAGSFYCHYVGFLDPNSFDLMWSIRFVLMVMVGGMQSLWGALLGTALLIFAGNEWLHVFAEYEILIYGAILLGVVLFLPSGLVSLFSTHRFSRKSPGRAREPAPEE